MTFDERKNDNLEENNAEKLDDFFLDFSSEDLIDERNDTREMCWRCKRPVIACWCKYLPEQKINITTTVYILQHPYEKSRCLQTAEMLMQAFETDHCKLYRGKRFPINKYEELHKLADLPNSILLFPSNESTELQSYLRNKHIQKTKDQGCDLESTQENMTATAKPLTDVHKDTYNLIVLDGTWHQAKGILFCNPFLQTIPKVHLENTGLSRYIIRTQPTDQGLSTVESVSLALSLLEDRIEIYNTLMVPLDALCQTQLEHGAVHHHSKERLELLGLKYPMKDNLKLYPENEDKLLRKKQRKINRMMNRLKIKKADRQEFLNNLPNTIEENVHDNLKKDIKNTET